MSHQQLLTQQYINNTLPHAILINGPIGSGKFTLAHWLVNVLLCKTLQRTFEHQDHLGAEILMRTGELHACGTCKTCLLAKNQSYPDHLTIELTGASIGVDDVRRANAFLEKTAHIGKFKSILIPNSQVMTVAAANALLKTLEEPSPDSIIILLTNDIDLLLPTIISRCRLITMKGPVGEVLLNKFKQNDDKIKNSDLNGFINLSHLPELQDSNINEAYLLFKSSYLQYLLSAQNKTQESESADIFLKMMCEQTYALRWLEKITVNLLREHYLQNTLSQSSKEGERHVIQEELSPNTLNQLFKAIIETSKVLKLLPQANETFILEKLHLSLHDIIRGSE